MEIKHLIWIGIIVLIIIGIIWLASLLPGLGLGFGKGKGDGQGGSGPGQGNQPTQPTAPPPGSKSTVILTTAGPELHTGGSVQKVSLEQLKQWTKEGREFEVKMKKDVTIEVVEAFRTAQTETNGRIRVLSRQEGGFVD